jgi:uncharacterized membrane protein
MNFTVKALLWISAIGTGIIGGLFFAFSTFIMTALGRTGPVHGILAMNSINATILRSFFMPVFSGTTLTSALLALIGIVHWREPGAPAMLAGGVIYVIGMFVCTMVFNVPRNNALMKADPNSADGAALWARYLKEWTFWNHVRTIASVVATVLFTVALCARAGVAT